MKKRNILILSAIILVLFLFISGCAATSRISSFFESGEFKQHARIIDFGLFFVMFFALTYLGLSKMWGEGFGKPGAAKGPIVGLSIALALALAFALISQTSFSITTIFPIAKAFFFIILWFLLWGLLVMSKIFGDHWGGKVVAAILAGMMTYLLFCIATHMICQMSDNMDDPACQSDFFNAATNIIGRLFGIDEMAWAAGGTYWPESAWGYASDAPPPDLPHYSSYSRAREDKIREQKIDSGEAVPEKDEIKKEPKDTCRMDVTFVVGKATPLVPGPGALQAKLEDYVKSVKAMEGGKTIRVYGFASVEGEKGFNWGLSGRRADSIKSMIRKIDSSVSVSAYAEGEVSIFSTEELQPNRRVVLSTEPLSRANLAASIPPGSAEGCPPPEEEETEDAEGEEGEEDEDDEGGLSGWWLLLLLLIPLFLLLRKRGKHVNIAEAIKRKSQFQKELDGIKQEKDRIRIEIAKPETADKDEDAQRQTARRLLESIESDLKKRKTIQQIAKDYHGREDDIAKETVLFGVDAQHARQLQRIILKLKDRGVDHKAPNFNDELLNTVAEMVSGHTLLKELHDFMRLQERLKKRAEVFMKFEKRLLAYAAKSDRRKALLDVTQKVQFLANRLKEKADDIISVEEVLMEKYSEEENNRMWKKYTEEKRIIKELHDAIELEKKQLSRLSVAIIKPEAGQVFRPGDRLKLVAGVVNGKPPFRCKLFWGEGMSKVPLTEELHFNRQKVDIELPDSFESLSVPGKREQLLAERFFAKRMRDHYRISIMLYDATRKPGHHDYSVTGQVIPDCAVDDVIIEVKGEAGKEGGEQARPGREEEKAGGEQARPGREEEKAGGEQARSGREEERAVGEVKGEEEKHEAAPGPELPPKVDIPPKPEVPPARQAPPSQEPSAKHAAGAERPEREEGEQGGTDIPIDVDEEAVKRLKEERAEEYESAKPPTPAPPRKSAVSDAMREEVGKAGPFLRVQGEPVYVVVDSESRETVKLEDGDRISIPFFRKDLKRDKITFGRRAESALVVVQKSSVDIHASMTVEKKMFGKARYFLNAEKGAPPAVIIKKDVGVVVPFADEEDKERLRNELADDSYGFLQEYLTAYNKEKGLFAEKRREVGLGDVVFLGPEYRFAFAKF